MLPKVSSLLGWDAVSLHDYYLTFQVTITPLSSGTSSPGDYIILNIKALHSSETSVNHNLTQHRIQKTQTFGFLLFIYVSSDQKITRHMHAYVIKNMAYNRQLTCIAFDIFCVDLVMGDIELFSSAIGVSRQLLWLASIRPLDTLIRD